ncbi:hypothetical protein DL98DRAFT_537454 [Cadophora sp. DSE1049]|nr:hypothetical protein DL98DRAFT_537454 [Cadophora sp. DSE1049]
MYEVFEGDPIPLSASRIAGIVMGEKETGNVIRSSYNTIIWYNLSSVRARRTFIFGVVKQTVKDSWRGYIIKCEKRAFLKLALSFKNVRDSDAMESLLVRQRWREASFVVRLVDIIRGYKHANYLAVRPSVAPPANCALLVIIRPFIASPPANCILLVIVKPLTNWVLLVAIRLLLVAIAFVTFSFTNRALLVVIRSIRPPINCALLIAIRYK